MHITAVCCAAASAWLLTAPPPRRRLRRREGLRPRGWAGRRGALAVESARLRTVICVLAPAAVGWAVSGVPGLGIGAVAGCVLSAWVRRLESKAVVQARADLRRDLPLAADLLAACASIGRSVEGSLPMVADAVGGPLGGLLAECTSRLALGVDPSTEWRRLADDPELAQLGRTLRRSFESGAPLAAALTRLAEDSRRERRTQTQLRARSVGTKAAAPLAACFLPAFMLVGVVPIVAGSFQHLFG